MATKDSVPVTAVWLLKSPEHLGDRIEVRLELDDGRWVSVLTKVADEGPISHIVETAGIRTGTVVTLDGDGS